MKTLRRSVLVGAAALAMTATAMPAMATSTGPGNCTTNVRINEAGFNEASAVCTTGSGRYRVVVVIGGGPNLLTGYYGPCVEVGQTSKVTYGSGGGVLIRIIGPRVQVC